MIIADLLAQSDVERTDAEMLLGFVLGNDRTWVIAHGNDSIDEATERAFTALAARRRAGEPLAYITGTKEFYGRTFAVCPGILVPRPCTEELITTALDLLHAKHAPPVREIDNGIVAAVWLHPSFTSVQTIVDVGTGSGCIAITLACEVPALRCIATDVSTLACDVAQSNAFRLGMAERVEVKLGNALEPVMNLTEPFIVVTNPPYVADAALLADDVRMHEPRTALMGGGADGGDILRAIVQQAKAHPFCRGILAECLSAQASIVTD